MINRPGRPTPAEVDRSIRRAVQHPEGGRFFDSFADVSHEHSWGDGTLIYIKDGVDLETGEQLYDEYTFHRTGDAPDAGDWLPTGVTTGIPAAW